jgi:hypothetical protein
LKIVSGVEAKRSVLIHFMTYIIVCAFLVLIYFVTDGNSESFDFNFNNIYFTSSNSAPFWPIFPIAGWGVGVAIHAAVVFISLKNFDSEVEKEFLKLKATSGEKFSSDETKDFSSREN